MTARICIVTAGHLSTCPRMVKAADALAGAGHRVRVVSTRSLDWAIEADAELHRQRSGAWQWTVVDYHRQSATGTYLRSGLRFRASQAVVRVLGLSPCPLALMERAYGRMHTELVRAVLDDSADFIYGGTTGALAVVAEAARRAGVRYALDLEDFHSAEREDSRAGRLSDTLAEHIERAVLPGAAFLTAGSPAIAAAYTAKYHVHPIAINNTFPLLATAPDLVPSPGEGLRLYWFSQTIGPGRGLEDGIRAMGLAELPGELHLRGQAIHGYLDELGRLADAVAPRLRIVYHAPVPPHAMIEVCRGLDVGLALEPGFSLNNRVALSNKLFIYLQAGLAVAVSDTPGQRLLARELGHGAILYQPGDVGTLAAGLKRWSENKGQLARAKAATWEAARRRWHWEHPEERGALLRVVGEVLGR